MEEKPLMEKRNQYTYIKYNSIRPNRENIRMKKKKKGKKTTTKKGHVQNHVQMQLIVFKH